MINKTRSLLVDKQNNYKLLNASQIMFKFTSLVLEYSLNSEERAKISKFF